MYSNYTHIIEYLKTHKAVAQLFYIIHNYFEQFRLVGGCVRDLICAKPLNTVNLQRLDIDLATTFLPEQLIKLFNQLNIKTIPTGIKHGTITIIIDNKHFEITTLRIDKNCNGRHADIEFTDQWQLDAARRDFSFNALYLDLNGKLYDYFNGINDLQNKQIKFIGSSQERIEEDHLRLLRLLRFGLRYSNNKFLINNYHDFIDRNKILLTKLSGERLSSEITKLIIDLGIKQTRNILDDTKILSPFKLELSSYNLPNSTNLNLSWFMLFVSNEENINKYTKIFKFSNKQKNYCRQLQKLIDNNFSKSYLLYNFEKEIIKDYLEFCNLQNLDYQELSTQDLENFVKRKMPINAQLLQKKFNLTGKELGTQLKFIEKKWVESNFTLTEKQLIELL